jgi:hypothetical protein
MGPEKGIVEVGTILDPSRLIDPQAALESKGIRTCPSDVTTTSRLASVNSR